ncbi:MAG: UDP-3-O-(3-hydroxymyristoyl)glucosamine N-acyltransferase [Bacteroidota bacterium]|nr:UDP-3-O-(3-hydroxymyristoyl)glucosamine N-acyltransferase [Bacteroidota bacterium]
MQFTVEEIAKMVNGKVDGNREKLINHFAPIEDATEGAISFLSNNKYLPHLYKSTASAVLVGKDFISQQTVSPSLIYVEDVYTTLALLLEKFGGQKEVKKGIEEPSYIASSAVLGENCYIGAFTYIGESVKIGKNVQVYPHTYIGDYSVIGDNTVLHAGSKIYSSTTIGKNCILHSGCVVGSDGFGFAPQKNGSFQKIPQLGRVIIHDFVEIGANTTIDRATINATIIGKGVKLDNLIQVAHNVEIGSYTAIAAQAGISGSTKIGQRCLVGGQVGIVGHIEVAEGTQIGAQSGVAQAITQPGQKLFGSPALPFREAVRAQKVFKSLPELEKRIIALEKELKASKSRDL